MLEIFNTNKPAIDVANYTARKFKANEDTDSVVKVTSSDWFFTQCTALASCNILKPNTITESTIKYANENFNAWSNEDLKKYYASFVGGHNYCEHEQDPMKSYGFICDAQIRKVDVNDKEFVYYVDLMVATNRKKVPDPSLVKRIENNAIVTFSMGCESSSVVCSRCGTISEESDDDCTHLKYQLGEHFITKDGKKSITIAIISDRKKDNSHGSIEFYEISWVKDPAFKGAVAGYRVDVPDDTEMFFKIPKASLAREDSIKNGIDKWAQLNFAKVIR